MASKVGNIGLIIRLSIKDQDGDVVDVSSASSTKDIRIRKPDDTLLTKGASFTNSGTDGKIQVTLASGDLSLIGDYFYEGHVVITAGTFTTDPLRFEVVESV